MLLSSHPDKVPPDAPRNSRLGLPFSVGVVLVVVVATISCDAKRGEDPAPVPPETRRSVEDAPYRAIPEPLRGTLNRTHDGLVEVRLEAVRDLIRMADERAIPRLVQLLGDEHTRVRCAAAEAIGVLGAAGRAATHRLSEMLADGAPTARQCAMLALAQVGGDEALEALLGILENARHETLQEVIDALGRLGRIEAVEAIIGHLESTDPTTVSITEAALVRIGPGAADSVRTMLESDQPGARCAAASILARWDSLRDEPRMRRMSRYDSAPQVRVCALGALGRLGDEEAVAELAEIVGDSESQLRAEAAEALGVAATGPAVRVLIRSLTSFHRENRPNPAQAALLAIGQSTARPGLEEALPTGPPLRRALVAETLGLLGDRNALPSLERAAMDTDEMVREAAAAAVEMLRMESPDVR